MTKKLKNGNVTLKDIADEVNVSSAAVSRALNKRGGVSLPIQRKIEKIAERYGYSPYIKARQSGIFSSNLNNIAILYAFAGEHLTKEIQRGINSILKKTEFYELRLNIDDELHVYNEERKKIFIDRIIQDNSIRGLLSVFIRISESEIGRLQKNNIPVILLNNKSNFGKCIYIDNVDAGYKATIELIKLNRKKIGLIMPPETTENVWADRIDGYRKALKEAKIKYDPYLIIPENTFSLKESALATNELLKREPEIDGIIYGCDKQAYGGIEALKELGKNIPQEIAVIGFDNIEFSRITNPPITSVQQPMFDMGKEAARMLIESIKNKNFKFKEVKLKTKLILRQSTHINIKKEKFLKKN